MKEHNKKERIKKAVVSTFTVPLTSRGIKENISINTNINTKDSKKKLISQAIKLHQNGNIIEAAKCYKNLIKKRVNDHRVFCNYGIILIDLGKLEEAEILIRKAIKLKPNLSDYQYNLGIILRDLGRSQEAEIFFRKAIELKPNFPEAYSSVGIILITLGKLKEAEISIKKAIELKPDLPEAHLNLGIIFKALGKLQDAHLSTKKAIKLNPNYSKAHSQLGIILRLMGNLKESEISTRKAIELNPNLSTCYQNLGLLLYAKGDINSAKQSIKKAFSINPNSKDNLLLLSILGDQRSKVYNESSTPRNSYYPVTLKRKVDSKLIRSLYKIKSIDLNKYQDPSYGNAKGSDYKLFEDNKKITEELEKDLINLTKEIVNSEVFFRDSFFTILSGDSTITKHNHIGPIDKSPGLYLWKQKYSLVYYLSVGDQNCEHPGILKLYPNKYDNNAEKEILPTEGLIVIFPADKYHSVKYNGNKDRIIIGVNFYRI